jgi:hypothetical protein
MCSGRSAGQPRFNHLYMHNFGTPATHARMCVELWCHKQTVSVHVVCIHVQLAAASPVGVDMLLYSSLLQLCSWSVLSGGCGCSALPTVLVHALGLHPVGCKWGPYMPGVLCPVQCAQHYVVYWQGLLQVVWVLTGRCGGRSETKHPIMTVVYTVPHSMRLWLEKVVTSRSS